jgi:hypothetical protein
MLLKPGTTPSTSLVHQWIQRTSSVYVRVYPPSEQYPSNRSINICKTTATTESQLCLQAIKADGECPLDTEERDEG